jgi:ParB family transcriptional regulator, chromosome partitioning protein
VALEGAEGQGAESGSEDLKNVSDTDLPAFLTEDLPDAPAAMLAAE